MLARKGDPVAHQTAPYLPFALPQIGEEEIAEVVEALRSDPYPAFLPEK